MPVATSTRIGIGAGNFEYGNFENGNFDTNLILKIGWRVSSKISSGNFEFIIENVVRNYVTYEHITGPQN